LGIFQHCILKVYVVLRRKIAGIGCTPVPIQCGAYLLISHNTLQRHEQSMLLRIERRGDIVAVSTDGLADHCV
jgi:hypothetical protein